MIIVKPLTELRDFESLKKGDVVAVEWKRDSYKNKKRTRFATYEIVENKKHMTEIILQTVNNVYFNYSMLLEPEKNGHSNVSNIILLAANSFTTKE